MNPPLQRHTEYLHWPKDLRVLPIHRSPSSLPRMFLLFTVLPFPECHVFGIIQYAPFPGLVSFTYYMHLKFLHFISWLNNSLLFIAE